jgi:hypothetical protein
VSTGAVQLDEVGFVLWLPPVVAMSSYELVEWLGPTLQRYATAP